MSTPRAETHETRWSVMSAYLADKMMKGQDDTGFAEAALGFMAKVEEMIPAASPAEPTDTGDALPLAVASVARHLNDAPNHVREAFGDIIARLRGTSEPQGEDGGWLALGVDHGCFTGDCPDDGHSCVASLREHVEGMVREAARLRGTPEPTPDTGEDALVGMAVDLGFALGALSEDDGDDDNGWCATTCRVCGAVLADHAGNDPEPHESTCPVPRIEDIYARLRGTSTQEPTVREFIEWLDGREGVSWRATLKDARYYLHAVGSPLPGASDG